MKNVLLITAISLFSLVSKGQVFVDPANQWNVSESENFGATITGIFKFFGDSVIGNNVYNKIYVSYDSTLNNWMYRGLLREDSNRVYYFPEYGNSEGLLYDFNLSAGDTAHIISAWMPEPREFICQSIDSITYNGASYKRWNFNYPAEQWIEGIGSTEGPLYSGASGYVFDLWFTLLCFHRNDTLIYIEPGVTKCFYTTVGLNDISISNEIKLSPNPLQKGQSLKICSDNTISKLEIFTSVGFKLKEYLTIDNKSAIISTENLTHGMYLLKVYTRNHLTFVKKVSIE